MKLTINAHTKDHKHITSYRFVFGCKRARDLGLLDENGDGREVLLYTAKNGILLIPIDSKHGTISYGGYSTEICKSKDKFYGEVFYNGMPRIWSAPSLAESEAEFRKLVDRLSIPD